jgi:hypothetical protein
VARARRMKIMKEKRETKLSTSINDVTNQEYNCDASGASIPFSSVDSGEVSRNNITFTSSDSEEELGSSMPSTSIDSEIWNFGKPTWRYRHCKALLWYEERLSPNRSSKMPSFGICCKNENTSLPAKKENSSLP